MYLIRYPVEVGAEGGGGYIVYLYAYRLHNDTTKSAQIRLNTHIRNENDVKIDTRNYKHYDR